MALAGAVALGAAIGIGRFAFTPLLPMMLSDRVIDLPSASWLASANYFGYLVGALLCTFEPWLRRRVGRFGPVDAPATVRAGLVATVVLTLGMAVPAPVLWPLLRFLAGVASALVFVYTSGWCLTQLARRHLSARGALMYTGPGAGIALGGLAASAMVAAHWSAATGWLIFGALAALLSAMIWRTLDTRRDLPPSVSVHEASVQAPAGASPRHGGLELGLHTLAYGLAGFGYIITATFLPVIARQAIPGSRLLDLFWPIFGLGVTTGAWVASRLHSRGDLRLRLVACYLVQAIGIAVTLAFPGEAGFALGSLLLGLPFTIITFYAMQEVRRLRPTQVSSIIGLLTAVYGVGQIIGPPLVAALVAHSTSVGAGFNASLETAAAALVLGALMYATMARLFPLVRTS